jgi:serine/threonine protein kinase
LANRKLGKYEIIERLGRGGMAEVYRGYHASLDRYVAIKVLHAFLADDPEFKTRFEREAQNVAKLKHHNIVQVYDFEYDEAGDSFYMVMELVDGPTLKERLSGLDEGGQRLPLAESLRIVKEAAAALSYAHSRNMIHRDVKPANLMLDHDDRVVLTDFGIAKIVTGAQFTASGGMVGTPAYMAPEQGLGEAGDERSDLYSLGVILYQLVTGGLPYDAETPLATILKHLNAPIPSARQLNPELPEAIDQLITKAIAKEPLDRYQTANDLIEDLERFERGEAITPSVAASTTLLQSPNVETVEIPRYVETGRGGQAAPPRRRFPWWGWGGIVAGLAASIFLIGSASGIFSSIFQTSTPTADTISVLNAATETALAAGSTEAVTISSTPEPPTSTPTLTQTSTPTDTPLPTDTPTSTLTRTPTTTPTLTTTPSPTPATPIGISRRSIVMRIGPDLRFPSNGNLNLGDQSDIIGISQDQLWFYVLNANGLRGWVDASQLSVYGNVTGVPIVASPTSTPSYTPSPTRTPTASFTPTPTRTPTVTPTPTITLTPTPNQTQTLAVLTQAAVAATQTTAACVFDYQIIQQDPEDGGLWPVNTAYERVITLFNSGTCAWEPNTYLRWVEGEDFNSRTSIFIPEEVGVGETYELIFSGTTPLRFGEKSGTWQLRTPGGISIGEPIVISIQAYG